MDGPKRRVDSRRVSDVKDATVIDQIMLKFRPIAPRPVTAESSGYVLPANDLLKRKRVKRKYVRVKKKVNKGESLKKDNENWFDLDCDGNDVVVTDPVEKLSSWISFDLSGDNKKGMMNNNNLFISEPSDKYSSDLHGVDLVTAVGESKLVESWITVESMTGTCDDRKVLGYTDDEIWKNLETDSCPGFVSNGYDEVVWVNPAYRRMLDLKGEGGGSVSDVAVWLVVKVEKSTMVNYLPAFSCRVRIEYLCEKKMRRMIVPCDVCKMDSGEFAWLLDVRFALSLGPLN